MKETETQKAIEAEFEDFDKQWLKTVHKSGAKYYGLECYVAGRSKSLEEKEKRVRELEEALRELLEWSLYVKTEVKDKAKQLLNNH